MALDSENQTENQTVAFFYETGLSVIELKRLNYPRWGYQLTGAVLVLIGIFGTWFNLVGLYIFAKNKHLQSPTNFFIVGLLICDLSMAVFGNPLPSTAALNGSWFAGDFLCTWEGFVVYFFGLSALYILTAISVDRYIVIVKPLKSKRITKRVAVAAVASCFAGGAFWSILPLIGWGSYGLEAPGFYCGLDYEDNSWANKTYIIAMFIFCFSVPVGIMIYCYFYVYMTVRNISRNTVWDMKSRVARRNLRIEKKMLKSIVMMCACFLVCWTPYAIMAFWQSFGDADAIPIVLTAIPAVMAKSELVWNPIIYVATNKQFRKAFYAIIPCSKLREKLIKHEEAVKEMESEQSGIEDTMTRTKAMTSKREQTTNVDSTVMTRTSSTPNPNAVVPSISNSVAVAVIPSTMNPNADIQTTLTPNAEMPTTSNPNSVTPSTSNHNAEIPSTQSSQAVVPTSTGMPVIDC